MENYYIKYFSEKKNHQTFRLKSSAKFIWVEKVRATFFLLNLRNDKRNLQGHDNSVAI